MIPVDAPVASAKIRQSITAGGILSTIPIGSAGLSASTAVWQDRRILEIAGQNQGMQQADRRRED